MTRNLQTLATRYIDEVIEDQQKLGYTKAVRVKARRAAVADAERALRELARAGMTKAVAV